MKRIIIGCVVFLILTGIGTMGIKKILDKKKPPEEDYKTRIQKLDQVKIEKASEISAWIGWWDEKPALGSLETNFGKIKTIMPMWYRLDKNGVLTDINESKLKQDLKEAATTKAVEIMPTLTNEFDPDRTSKLFDTQELKDKFLDDLVFKAISSGYKGWDIDFEEMYPGDKNGFTDLMAALAERLHEKKLLLSVTLQAKTDSISDSPGSKALDWEKLGQSADQIRIMAYDFHSDGSEAGPITPLDEYEKLLKITTNQIPQDKIVIGLPTYGYDWVGEKGEALQYKDAINRVNDLKIKIKRDDTSSELTGTYKNKGQNHTIWYEDSDSMDIKVKIAKNYNIDKFSIWRLGGEDPRIWEIK